MGAMQRRKGARFEREVASVFALLFPDSKRGIGQSRSGGEIPDVDGTPFWPECKRGNSSSATAALKQAVEARSKAVGRGAPLAVIRRDGERIISSMYLEDFLILLAGYHIPDPFEREAVVNRIREAIVKVEGVIASGKRGTKRKGNARTT